MRIAIITLVLTLTTTASAAERLKLTSPDLRPGQPLSSAQVYNGWGCTGGNLSPALTWQAAPKGTKSYAVTVYDPDAPTGSGFWHWLVYDIPAEATGLPAAAKANTLPAGAEQGRNDFGVREFSGACPPVGSKPHRYVFTVYALKVEKLGVPADASAAVIGFHLQANALAKATLTASYRR